MRLSGDEPVAFYTHFESATHLGIIESTYNSNTAKGKRFQKMLRQFKRLQVLQIIVFEQWKNICQAHN